MPFVWQSLPAPWCQACLGHSSAPLAVMSLLNPGEGQRRPRGGVGCQGHSTGCGGTWLLLVTRHAVLGQRVTPLGLVLSPKKRGGQAALQGPDCHLPTLPGSKSPSSRCRGAPVLPLCQTPETTGRVWSRSLNHKKKLLLMIVRHGGEVGHV